MKAIKKSILTTLLLIIGMGASLVSIFNHNDVYSDLNYTFEKTINKDIEPVFKDALPVDFFGDYKNPEF